MIEKNNNEPQTRAQIIRNLKTEVFDILIIGGGATGSGAALDAASRGLKVALVEAHDFSSGTSSRSTKLIHGGVRYLENAVKHIDVHEYALVRDALHERIRFLKNAPHLTRKLAIITPVYSWFEAGYYLAGLKLYDFVAGKSSLGNSQFLSREQTLKKLPHIKSKGLKGGVIYYDGQFDDARMNITLVLSAIELGVQAVNYVSVVGLIKEGECVVGATVFDKLTNDTWPIKSRVVINATGTFADTIRKFDNPEAADLLIPSQGSHLILPEKFSSDCGMIIPKTSDNRVLFLLPWQGKTMVGTTDQENENTIHPQATNEEVDFIIKNVQNYLDIPLKRSDILATFSGLRPLPKPCSINNTTASISRDHLVEISPSQLITIIGGKWTTYRKMAEDVVNAAINVAQLQPLSKTKTKNFRLVGAHRYHVDLAYILSSQEGLPLDIAEHLAHSYGDRARVVLAIDKGRRRARLVAGHPYIEAEIIYAITHEFAVQASDIVARRLRLAFLDNQAALMALPTLISIMATTLGFNKDRQIHEQRQCEAFLATMHTKPTL